MKTYNLKAISILIFILVLTFSSKAQKAYIKFGGGFSFNQGASNVEGITNENYLGNTYYGITQIDFSFGSGLNLGGAVGYTFNKNIGVELGLSHHTSDEWSYKHSYTNSPTSIDVYTYTISASVLRINPSIFLTVGNDVAKFKIRFGTLLYKGNIYDDYSESSNNQNVFYKSISDVNYAFGFNSAIGTEINFDEHFGIYGELELISLSYAPSKGELTYLTVNGKDYLSTLSASQKEINYVDEYTYDQNAASQPTQTNYALKTLYTFGSIGFNFGIKYTF